ncbi:hypothetical protein V1506DRAFT_545879, partial [Lipomyces tetrasporus]
MVVESDRLHLPGRIARCYQEEVPHKSGVSTLGDTSINCFQEICSVLVDSRFLVAHVNTHHSINSQARNGEDSSRSAGVSTLTEPVPVWTSAEIVQAVPKSVKLQRCEFLPLRGMLQAWSIEDKDRAFDEMVAFVNDVVEVVVNVRQQSTSSGATPMSSDDIVGSKQMGCKRISESQAYGEIHDILDEFTNLNTALSVYIEERS